MAANARFTITAEDKTAAAFNAVQGHFSKLESTLTGLKNLAFGTIIGAGIAELTRKIYDATTQWQSWQYTLEGAGLSTKETAQQLDFLKNTSLELGLSIKDVGQAFGRFILTGKAAGMQIGEMDQDFKAVSEAMRVFHLTSQQSQRSWIALTEVMAMGTLHSRQFTQQLGRDWPGIGALIAQAMYPGENSLKRFMDDMEHGKISSQAFMDAFQKVMATPAMQGALADAEASLQAATGRLSTAFFELFNQADSPALTDMVDAINALSSTINDPNVKSGIDELVAGLANIAKYAAEGLSNIAKLYGYIASQVGENASSTTFAHAQKDFLSLERMQAAHQENTEAYKKLYADFQSSEQYLVGRGVGSANAMSTDEILAKHGIKKGTGYTNEAGTAIPEDLAKMIYGPTGHKDTAAPRLEKTAIAMPSISAAKPVDLKVHFNADSAEQSLADTSQKLQTEWQTTVTQLFQTDKRQWQEIFSPINEAFTQTITGVIRGTETWHMGMKKIFASIEQEFIGMGVKMVTNWAASEMAKLAVSETTGMSQVAVATTVSKESTAVSLASDAKMILGSAWTAAANVYKSVSSIPFVGWILAPAMAIAAAVEVAGFAKRIASAEGGWWQVPSDQLANIHKDEMVLPKHLAQPLREQIEGDGHAGGGATHIHIHALDSRSMAEALKRNPGAMAKAIQHAARGHAFA